MPRSKPISKIIEAAMYYAEKTHTTVDVNYILINGVNDSDRDAHAIGKLLKGKSGIVLVVCDFNPVPGQEDYAG